MVPKGDVIIKVDANTKEHNLDGFFFFLMLQLINLPHEQPLQQSRSSDTIQGQFLDKFKEAIL